MPVAAAGSQGPQTPPAPSPFSVTIAQDVSRDLPAHNVLAILETVDAEVIADRFNSGGLSAGGESQLVAPLGSRAQTRYRIGDIDVGSPVSGQPMFFPELAFWQQIEAATALMPGERSAPSLAIALDPARPPSRWTGLAEGFLSRPSLVSSGKSSSPPPIARLHDWTYGSALVGGPLGRSNGMTAGAAFSESGSFVRGRQDVSRESARSGFVHHRFTPAPGREVRTLGWLQSVRAPASVIAAAHGTARDSALHLQSSVQSSVTNSARWRIFGGLSQRRRQAEPLPSWQVADRLVDGPLPSLLTNTKSVERRWTIGTRLSRTLRRVHDVSIGGDFSRATAGMRAAPVTRVGELVDGLPARLWDFSTPARESRRHVRMLTAFASDRLALSPAVTLDASLAIESTAGAAEGGLTGIRWHTLLPRITARWVAGTRAALTLTTGYRRAANQLTLDLLAYGDPAASSGQVFRWDNMLDTASGPLVARVGPGTGGDSAFSGIDPGLRRPHADEFAIALESRVTPAWVLRVAGIARRESSLVNAVNIGVPASAYRTLFVPDANADLAGAADDQQLPVYEQLPETFGQDRYLLTNPADEAATMGALVLTAQVTTSRLFLFVGATASAAVGHGANRGFRALENDQDAIGELFTTANASTNARGRLFSDRAYTIKWTTVYRFPGDIRLGAIARYQDGQPFSRIVVVRGLSQGTEFVQAFANGRSRFAFTGTLDVRVQKRFNVGPRRLDAIVDVYNLLNMRKEVEEYVVTGDRFRTPTAVQPPLALHAGLRVAF